MKILIAIIFGLILFVLSFPFAKKLQLEGYSLRQYLKKIYTLTNLFGGKNKLVFTKRMARLLIAHFVVVMCLTIPYFALLDEIWWLVGIAIELVLINFIFLFSACLVMPLEEAIKRCYIKKACKILKNFHGEKIAITGSFGKTSTKNFLAHILRKKFKVCTTPKNFNTPMGLCKTAIENLQDLDEIIIVEMGARHQGDIAQLMQMLMPQYGIMTAVGEQHLETFGSLENIKKTKFELCSSMKNGKMIVFDGYCDVSKELYDCYHGKKCLIGSEKCPVKLLKASYSSKGTLLTFEINGRTYKSRTQIIGSALIHDVLLAMTMALMLGLSEEEIVASIADLRPSPHRLQLIKGVGCTIIDDSYNSNILGAEQACECIKLFKGKRIIISPGVVEQGTKQYEKNFFLGKMMGQSCDELIVMNQTNKTALTKGAESGGMKKEHIHFASNRRQQAEVLKSVQTQGCVVLFENDLPDNYK